MTGKGRQHVDMMGMGREQANIDKEQEGMDKEQIGMDKKQVDMGKGCGQVGMMRFGKELVGWFAWSQMKALCLLCDITLLVLLMWRRLQNISQLQIRGVTSCRHF